MRLTQELGKRGRFAKVSTSAVWTVYSRYVASSDCMFKRRKDAAICHCREVQDGLLQFYAAHFSVVIIHLSPLTIIQRVGLKRNDFKTFFTKACHAGVTCHFI